MVDHIHICENSTLTQREGEIEIWKLKIADIYASNKSTVYGGILLPFSYLLIHLNNI